jgi:ribosomal-protein-alanine N-acetyltransferase
MVEKREPDYVLAEGRAIQGLTRPYAAAHAEELLSLNADNGWDTWTFDNLMSERPWKWRLSLVVKAHGSPAAYAICSRRDKNVHLHHLVVGSAFRSRGIGRQIMRRIAARAAEFQLPEITLKVYTHNLRAVEFYRRLGFEITGEENGLYWMRAFAASLAGSKKATAT